MSRLDTRQMIPLHQPIPRQAFTPGFSYLPSPPGPSTNPSTSNMNIFTPNNSHNHAHAHPHGPSSSLPCFPAPSYKSTTTKTIKSSLPPQPSSSSFLPFSSSSGGSSSKNSGTRPKLPTKKSGSSNKFQQRSVEISLKQKVEKSKGFEAFCFIPKSLPPAPPSSPVFGQSSNMGGSGVAGAGSGAGAMGGDYFGSRWQIGLGDSPGSSSPGKGEEQWVEDIGEGSEGSMDVDSE